MNHCKRNLPASHLNSSIFLTMSKTPTINLAISSPKILQQKENLPKQDFEGDYHMFDEVDKNNAYTEGESEEADQKGIHLHLGAI